MNDIYVDMRYQNRWIQKYFPNKDFVSINDLLACIEDLDDEVNHLKEELEDKAETEEEYKWEQADNYNDEVKMGLRDDR